MPLHSLYYTVHWLSKYFLHRECKFHISSSFPSYHNLVINKIWQVSNIVNLKYPRTFWFLILIAYLYLPFRSREVAFEAQTSRYLNEFEELAVLGKGGYGRVYKVCSPHSHFDILL